MILIIKPKMLMACGQAIASWYTAKTCKGRLIETLDFFFARVKEILMIWIYEENMVGYMNKKEANFSSCLFL